MLILSATTDKLQVITSSAALVDVHASYADVAAGVVTTDKQNTAISSAATTDVVAAPGSSTKRNVKTLHISNRDASLACDITVQYNQNASLFRLHKVTLNAGDTLEYIEGIGFFTITPTSKLDTKLIVTADIVRSATGMADVTGLTCSVKSGNKYSFEAHLYHISGATTTGFQAGINGPTSNNTIVGTIGTVTASVTASVHSAGVVSAYDTAATAQTTGSAGITLDILSGTIEPSADGTFAVRWTPEVAATVTIKRGSWCRVWQTDN